MKHILETKISIVILIIFFVFHEIFIDIHGKNKEILCSENFDQLKSLDEDENEDNSMLSNFLDFVNLDGENDKKLRESLITSYENTKVPNNAFTKESVLDHGQKMQGVSMNDGFSYYKMVTSSIRQHLKEQI